MKYSIHRIIGVFLVCIGAAFFLTGCGQMNNDAPSVKGAEGVPGEIINMPDGFSNVATKCDGHGNRIFTIYHGGDSANTAAPYGAVAIVPADPTCKAGAR